MDGSSLVSVVVPAFNAASHVESAVQSALDQTHSALEVIVVDDGSTDGTAAAVQRVARRDERVRLVSQPNAGVAAARNAGIGAARGAYVAPLDADDVWFPDKLAAQVARMRAGGPEMGMVYSWWASIDEDGAIRGSSFPCRVEGDVAYCLLYANFIGNASVPLFRRDALERVGGYDASLHARSAQGCEDWDVSLRVAARYHVGLAPGHHVGYRQMPGTMSMDVDQMARSYDAVVGRVRRAWRRVPDALYRWSKANYGSYLAAQSYAAGQYGDAVRWTLGALRADPAFALARYPYRVLSRSTAHLAAPGGVARALRGRRPPPQRYSLSEIDAEWAEEQWSTPWARSAKPYDVIRTRRWMRLVALGGPSLGPPMSKLPEPTTSQTRVSVGLDHVV